MDALFERISNLIEQARRRVMTSVNIAEVYTKYSIGQYIVEDEQQGNARAEYGKQVLKELSARLTERFGDGWSVESHKLCRRFFMVYSNSVNSVYPIQNEKDKQCLPYSATPSRNCVETPNFTLSWSHYLILLRVENPEARNFY
ncbi:MAG: hypothetical protein J6Y41_02440 [Bacteroidaceae bacterium]|nr:hypothetical protein [Bacteroidaceae bacterium]